MYTILSRNRSYLDQSWKSFQWSYAVDLAQCNIINFFDDLTISVVSARTSGSKRVVGINRMVGGGGSSRAAWDWSQHGCHDVDNLVCTKMTGRQHCLSRAKFCRSSAEHASALTRRHHALHARTCFRNPFNRPLASLYTALVCAWPIVGINNVIHEFRKHTHRIAAPLEKHRVTATINLFENFRVVRISGFEIYWRTDLHWWWSQIRDTVQNSHPIFVFTYINTLLVFLQYCRSYLCKAHKILPIAAFSFPLQDWLHDSPDCLLLLLSMSVFIFFSVLHFLVVGFVR